MEQGTKFCIQRVRKVGCVCVGGGGGRAKIPPFFFSGFGHCLPLPTPTIAKGGGEKIFGLRGEKEGGGCGGGGGVAEHRSSHIVCPALATALSSPNPLMSKGVVSKILLIDIGIDRCQD